MKIHCPLFFGRPIVKCSVGHRLKREQLEPSGDQLFGQRNEAWIGVQIANAAGNAGRIGLASIVEIPCRSNSLAVWINFRIFARKFRDRGLACRVFKAMTRQTAVTDLAADVIAIQIFGRLWRAMASRASYKEGIPLHLSGRHARHRRARQRHNCRVGRAVGNLAIRQIAVMGSRFEDVVAAPKLPHPLRKMRIEMTMED